MRWLEIQPQVRSFIITEISTGNGDKVVTEETCIVTEGAEEPWSNLPESVRLLTPRSSLLLQIGQPLDATMQPLICCRL